MFSIKFIVSTRKYNNNVVHKNIKNLVCLCHILFINNYIDLLIDIRLVAYK